MEIKYKNSEEGMNKFFSYIYDRIDVLKYYKAIVMLICIPIVVFGFFMWESPSVLIYKGISSRDEKVLLVLFVICIIWIFGVNKFFKKSNEKNIKEELKYINSDYDNEVLFKITEYKVIFDNSKIVEEYSFKYIKGIRKIGQYINIRINNGKVVMIPIKDVKEQTGKEIKEFISEFKEKIKG